MAIEFAVRSESTDSDQASTSRSSPRIKKMGITLGNKVQIVLQDVNDLNRRAMDALSRARASLKALPESSDVELRKGMGDTLKENEGIQDMAEAITRNFAEAMEQVATEAEEIVRARSEAEDGSGDLEKFRELQQEYVEEYLTLTPRTNNNESDEQEEE